MIWRLVQDFEAIKRRGWLFVMLLVFLLGATEKLTATPGELGQDGDSKSFIVASSANLLFTPKEVFFLVSDGAQIVAKLKGIIVAAEGSGSSSNDSVRYYLGSEVEGIKGELEYSVLILGSDGAYSFLPPRALKAEERDPRYNNSSLLREMLEMKQGTLATRKEKLDEHTMALKKLRLSAAGVSDIGKIIEIEEETKRLREGSSALEGDIEALRDALQLVKSIPQPYKFEHRRSQLTGQLAEMAEAALKAEEGALNRKRANGLDLDTKLQLIDSTRFDDLHDLEREYKSLTGQPVDTDVSSQNGAHQPGSLPDLEGQPTQKGTDQQGAVSAHDYFLLPEG